MQKGKDNYFKIIFQLITIIMTILIILFIIYAFKHEIFSSNESLIKYMKGFGLLAPLIFIFIQIVQVIFPVIPGGASCLAGVLAFGPVEGFIYNYVGLCIGSVISFSLSKKYGMGIIRKIFKEETVDKYLNYIKEKKFDKVFFYGILLPGAPDDLLCYIAGITHINYKEFIKTIIICKPLTLIFYSLFIYIMPYVNSFIK